MGQAVEVLKSQAAMAFDEVKTALEGVTEKLSWSVLPKGGSDYLHTDGSIHGMVMHIATCKIMYGSCGFNNTEIRWRDLAERVEKFEPNWQKALDYFAEAQKYWLASWENLSDEQLNEDRPIPSGAQWPACKIICTVTQHEAYHTGQIAMLRYAVSESDTKPPSVAEDIREYCSNLPSW